MRTMPAELACVEFAISWRSERVQHRDRLYLERVEVGIDSSDSELADSLQALDPGDATTLHYAPGALLDDHPAAARHTITVDQFQPPAVVSHLLPRVGRFYPRGFMAQALGCDRHDLQPLRVIGRDAMNLVTDLRHPLADYALEVSAFCHARSPAGAGPVISASDIPRLISAGGPGMQAPYPGVMTDFYHAYPFIRADTGSDAEFYRQPRIMAHLDRSAIAQVQNVYARLLQPGQAILDLMSSAFSHLPEHLAGTHVTGLGMNSHELESNRALDKWLVHDLNLDPTLPFDDAEFDAVICTVSVEYLLQPLQVFEEIARVLRPDGICIMTVSERWFQGKQVDIWTELHPFERQGLVLDYFLQTAGFEDVHTESIRRIPRPAGDHYSGQLKFSDPVYSVWASRRAEQGSP